MALPILGVKDGHGAKLRTPAKSGEADFELTRTHSDIGLLLTQFPGGKR